MQINGGKNNTYVYVGVHTIQYNSCVQKKTEYRGNKQFTTLKHRKQIVERIGNWLVIVNVQKGDIRDSTMTLYQKVINKNKNRNVGVKMLMKEIENRKNR